jgi:hypothetical protein
MFFIGVTNSCNLNEEFYLSMFFLKNYNNSFFQINYQAFLVDVFGRPKSFHGGHDNEDEV